MYIWYKLRYMKNTVTVMGSTGTTVQSTVPVLVSKVGRTLGYKEMVRKYGDPGDPDNFTVIDLPYPMLLAWDKDKVVKRMQCNKLVADRFKNIFADILSEYGLKRVQELGLDLFGGCVNYRPMRGTEKQYAAALKAGDKDTAYSLLSKHSWGTAIDLDPDRNLLKERWKSARFSRIEYIPMVNTFYKYGFVNLGIEYNKDAMHFESL